MNNMTVAAYTSGSPLPDAHSLHLALRGEDGVFEPLNYGIGVLFAETDFSSGKPAGATPGARPSPPRRGRRCAPSRSAAQARRRLSD